jgi:hypothetical protein
MDSIRQFGRDGYLVVPGLVPPEAVTDANAAIDALIAADPPPEGITGHHFYFERIEDQPALVRLLTGTRAYSMAEQLTARGALEGPPDVQVALTFPPYRHQPGAGHIDGLREIMPSGGPRSFTMLVGVILSDQSADDMGNLHVWPGTHRATAEFARNHGVAELLSAAAENSVPPVSQDHRLQVHGGPGDVFFAHYLLAHNIGGNTSSIVRRTVYMRLKCVGHDQRWSQILTDALAEYDGVRAAG